MLLAIAAGIVGYIALAFAVVAGYFPGIRLPLIPVEPALLGTLTLVGAAVAVGLCVAALQWEAYNLAPERLQALPKGFESVRGLLSRVYILQGVLLESAGVIGLVLFFCGMSFQTFLLFAGVPLVVLAMKITHLDDLRLTLERLLD